jgi:hypothetical protein
MLARVPNKNNGQAEDGPPCQIYLDVRIAIFPIHPVVVADGGRS